MPLDIVYFVSYGAPLPKYLSEGSVSISVAATENSHGPLGFIFCKAHGGNCPVRCVVLQRTRDLPWRSPVTKSKPGSASTSGVRSHHDVGLCSTSFQSMNLPSHSHEAWQIDKLGNNRQGCLSYRIDPRTRQERIIGTSLCHGSFFKTSQVTPRDLRHFRQASY